MVVTPPPVVPRSAPTTFSNPFANIWGADWFNNIGAGDNSATQAALSLVSGLPQNIKDQLMNIYRSRPEMLSGDSRGIVANLNRQGAPNAELAALLYWATRRDPGDAQRQVTDLIGAGSGPTQVPGGPPPQNDEEGAVTFPGGGGGGGGTPPATQPPATQPPVATPPPVGVSSVPGGGGNNSLMYPVDDPLGALLSAFSESGTNIRAPQAQRALSPLASSLNAGFLGNTASRGNVNLGGSMPDLYRSYLQGAVQDPTAAVRSAVGNMGNVASSLRLGGSGGGINPAVGMLQPILANSDQATSYLSNLYGGYFGGRARSASQYSLAQQARDNIPNFDPTSDLLKLLLGV